MRKVTVKLEMQMILLADEGPEITELIEALDWSAVRDTTTAADILDIEVLNHEILDSK